MGSAKNIVGGVKFTFPMTGNKGVTSNWPEKHHLYLYNPLLLFHIIELMNSRTGRALSVVAIAVTVLLFASGTVVGDHQAYAYGYYHHWWHHYWWHPWWHYQW